MKPAKEWSALILDTMQIKKLFTEGLANLGFEQ